MKSSAMLLAHFSHPFEVIGMVIELRIHRPPLPGVARQLLDQRYVWIQNIAEKLRIFSLAKLKWRPRRSRTHSAIPAAGGKFPVEKMHRWKDTASAHIRYVENECSERRPS